MTGTHINLKLDEICRGCLKEDGVMTSIFYNDIKPNVIKMFESCTSLEIKENDGYPSKMCNSCILRLHDSYQFQQMCVQSDIAVRTLNNKSEYTDKISSIKSGNNIKAVNNEICSVGNDELEDRKCNLFLNSDTGNIDEIKEENVNENSLDSYQCSTCSENFNNYQSLKEHQLNVHGCNKICRVCNKSCTSIVDLMEHSCRPVVLNKMTVKKYQCKECDKEYTSAHNLQIHMYSHSGVKPYSCEHCGKSFTKVHSLNSHVSLHTGYLSFLCSECGKGFTTSTGLKRHKISHTGERPYKCTICPGSFAASGDLTVHMRSHTGEKPYLCPTCGKAFSRISHLNTHARTHTGEKPYKCLRCDRAFAQSGDLKSHERTHTGEKPYSCSVCNKRFIQSSGLASHMRTHTGEKSYRCLICYKAFSQPSSLARHRRYHNE